MIHLYAIGDGAGDLGPLLGIDDRPVRISERHGLAGVVSDHPAAPPPSRTRALAHARVVEAACDVMDAVPVRYGAHHADEAALWRAIEERATSLRDTLRRVGGRAEIVVRLDRPTSEVSRVPAAVTGASGREYLEGRLAQERARRDERTGAVERLRERSAPFVPLAIEVVERDGPAGPERCLLVGRDDLADVLAMARAAAEADPSLIVGGPWPPYTFV